MVSRRCCGTDASMAMRLPTEEHVMADDKTKRGSPDSKRLNKSEPYEMKYAKSKRASPQRKAMANSSGSARSGAATKKRSPAKRAGQAARRSSAPKTGPAMKRTNAAPTRERTPTTRAHPHPPKEVKTVENTAPRTMREADAIDLLTDEHLEVSALFKRYGKLAQKEAPADERRALAQSICDMLKAHTRIEEEIFYPAARSAGIEADMLDEAQIEHASAKDLIARIEGGKPDDDLYDAAVTVLGEYVRHHVVEEHTEMLPKCRRAGMDLVALRGELQACKMSLSPEGDSASKREGADKGSDDESPGLLAKLSDKLFSTDSGADKSERADASRG
jgi:Hemerythrin HHE cation binding domain